MKTQSIPIHPLISLWNIREPTCVEVIVISLQGFIVPTWDAEALLFSLFSVSSEQTLKRTDVGVDADA